MMATSQTFKAYLTDQRGASAIEYGMIAALVVVGILAGVTAFSDANSANYQLLEDEITT
jgi:pilus assembly protein Flp/PilA